jgi:hypothetical protein
MKVKRILKLNRRVYGFSLNCQYAFMNKQFKMVVIVYFDHSNGTLAIRVLILFWCRGYDVDGARSWCCGSVAPHVHTSYLFIHTISECRLRYMSSRLASCHVDSIRYLSYKKSSLFFVSLPKLFYFRKFRDPLISYSLSMSRNNIVINKVVTVLNYSSNTPLKNMGNGGIAPPF